MNRDDAELVRGYFEGTLSEAQAEALRHLLEGNAAFREQFVREALFEDQLRAAAAADLEERSLKSFAGRDSACPLPLGGGADWREERGGAGRMGRQDEGVLRRIAKGLVPLAAGVILGALCSSVLWAYAGGRMVPEVELPLGNADFEGGAIPSHGGPPRECGGWGGDFSGIVGAEQGVAPLSGTRMLRFLRSTAANSPANEPSHVGDLFQLVDLRPYRALQKDARNPSVRLRAHFQSIPSGDGRRYSFGCLIYALQGDPARFADRWPLPLAELPAVGGKHVEALETRGWKLVESECAIPPGADYLVVHLKTIQTDPNNSEGFVDFPGQYVDDVHLFLRNSPEGGGVPRFNFGNLFQRKVDAKR
ncbi:MAG: hypothetical protein RLZZ142_2636 [Verrucomicrobiota bacterium]|jgi:hypothetical protein